MLIRHQNSSGKTNKASIDTGVGKDSPVIPGRQSRPSHSLHDRRKDPRLVGADLYVSRIARPEPIHKLPNLLPEAVEISPCIEEPTLTGSLYDELTCKTPKTSPNTPTNEDDRRHGMPLESRPCYRCVAHMYSVGIKRVFWTNIDGEWESAKVRDLVDEIERGGDDDSGNGRVFVTKHDVLRLMRLSSMNK